ncbi:hypothetical protein NA57DRAFT_43651 [Rhizodiscina lignyota]|uniref:Altered inheritance of mitochondria protein 6 n=1 Tax=Rhizodiscina lignyota TaxID=1504668 RepID=A0A9P4M7N5_9PEZI|nr:hypothetical protein NA57DRAFT_43651 [Rhizodiscina lignyota]
MRFQTALQSFLVACSYATPIPDVSQALQNILKNTHGSKLYTYPTDLTRGIAPKPFHSHNDYWRDLPFYSALSYGAVSVEADVWLYNDTLFVPDAIQVGHEESALTKERTFESLYINPILDTIKRENPSSPFVESPTRNGVYDTSSGQTLYLFVDVKTDGPTTWPFVLDALKPLSDAKYLSNVTGITDDAVVTSGPVTVVGTGNTPIQYFVSNPGTTSKPREVFYDAHLNMLSGPEKNITSAISPIASVDFVAVFGEVVNRTFNDTQLSTLKSQVATAHSRGIAARYWDQPGYPIGTRNAIWRTLIDNGVDLLNVDDLAGAAGFWEME